MEIDKEIQGKFEDNYHRSTVNIVFTYNWLHYIMRDHLDKYNITQQQYNILRILRGQLPNPATVNLLKDRMLDKMSDASRIVDRLVQKQLVTRCTNNKDRRSVDIRISDEGLDILSKLDIELKTRDVLKNNLTEEEAGQLSALLDKMRG
ncbi:MarR family transcriptional regulator [Mucilaginibacter sp. HMF5004]|uniref:MarR family winged helix-turn-helix transcriptional regulator n=1 Tax=Mucilaginibacter rivuli TaxID=2857527 RepID=UPI001C5FBCCF|nr:MarR family transcriptional regulator [Mucilaginibacter rivuli]MBW4891373.1 MarR family transcriptional regulator [Mucilaginibacter rivuli]